MRTGHSSGNNKRMLNNMQGINNTRDTVHNSEGGTSDNDNISPLESFDLHSTQQSTNNRNDSEADRNVSGEDSSLHEYLLLNVQPPEHLADY